MSISFSLTAGINEVVEILDCKDKRTIPSNITESVFLKQCHDNTYTIGMQPGSRSTYNGVCGPTVGVSMMAGFCGKAYNPYDAQELGYFEDITPGTRPGTMASGLNRLFREHIRSCPRGRWVTYGETDGYRFLNKSLNRMKSQRSKYRKAPFVALVRSTGKGLHYFSVVDIYFVGSTKPRTTRLTTSNALSGEARERAREEYLRNRRIRRTAERPKETRLRSQPRSVSRANVSKCRVAVNDYSVQKVYTCSNFLSMMRAANDIYGLSAIYRDYTYIAFKPN